MGNARYPIYHMKYGTVLDANEDAIVAAATPERAASLLERAINKYFKERNREGDDFKFQVYGLTGLTNTGVKADSEKVLYCRLLRQKENRLSRF